MGTCFVPGCAEPLSESVSESVCRRHLLTELCAVSQFAEVRRLDLADMDGREAVAPEPLPRPRIQASGQSAYGRAALQGIVDELGEAANGTRNNALNRAAFQAATLVAAGQVDEMDALRALRDTAEAVGLPKWEARQTIRSGWMKGLENPRTPRTV